MQCYSCPSCQRVFCEECAWAVAEEEASQLVCCPLTMVLPDDVRAVVRNVWGVVVRMLSCVAGYLPNPSSIEVQDFYLNPCMYGPRRRHQKDK